MAPKRGPETPPTTPPTMAPVLLDPPTDLGGGGGERGGDDGGGGGGGGGVTLIAIVWVVEATVGLTDVMAAPREDARAAGVLATSVCAAEATELAVEVAEVGMVRVACTWTLADENVSSSAHGLRQRSSARRAAASAA